MLGKWSAPREKDGSDFNYHDMQAIREIDKFRRTVKKFPSVTDILRILKKLGWQPPKKHG